jgi:predicted transcriptional regulator
MTRLTITLSDERHAALKQAAAQRRRSMGELIEESLEHFGIRTGDEALALVRRARQRAAMSEADALALAVSETRAARSGR